MLGHWSLMASPLHRKGASRGPRGPGGGASETGRKTQSENAVRKDGSNEKVPRRVERDNDVLAVGYRRDGAGANFLPPRGCVGEGDADADRQEPGRPGAPLAGGCEAGRAGAA